jgi:hypothetical protein
MLSYYSNRLLRDARELVKYPLWTISETVGPDNHYYKRRRIIDLQKKYGFKHFIETGTFFGQMINAVESHFDKVLSVELFAKLYHINKKAFNKSAKVKIYFGDSSQRLGEMIDEVKDNVIFWLDGHYSGQGTGIGELTSPILNELDIIQSKKLSKYCILIDDYRLFDGTDGYPTVDVVIDKIKSINRNSEIYIDKDCFVAIITSK